MKKAIYLILFSTCITIFCNGCRVAGYANNNSFGAPFPGVIYTQVTHPSFIGNKLDNTDDVEILGNAEGSASATDVLLVCTLGDCSIQAAKKDALAKYPGADDILNMEVDTQHISILSVFNTITTKINGKAVKYKK